MNLYTIIGLLSSVIFGRLFGNKLLQTKKIRQEGTDLVSELHQTEHQSLNQTLTSEVFTIFVVFPTISGHRNVLSKILVKFLTLTKVYCNHF